MLSLTSSSAKQKISAILYFTILYTFSHVVPLFCGWFVTVFDVVLGIIFFQPIFSNISSHSQCAPYKFKAHNAEKLSFSHAIVSALIRHQDVSVSYAEKKMKILCCCRLGCTNHHCKNYWFSLLLLPLAICLYNQPNSSLINAMR